VPTETFYGPDFTTLLAQAQAAFGEDAVVISTRRVSRDRATGCELVAADAGSVAPRRLPAAAPARPRPVPAPGPAPTGGSESARGAGGPRVVALVGPTGAGKTTTIAKLANHPDVFGGRLVGLLSLDTYRIGAVEQSRIYAELSGIPLEVVYEPRELKRAMRRLARCEIVLVDTAGRGPAARDDAAATRAALRELPADEVHLTLPAGLQPRLARRLVDDFREWGVTHLLPTKLDEAPGDDSLFELAASCGLPVRWAADGQEVPADLRAAAHPAAGAATPRAAREPALAGAR
jgi:flagellar biosynthesis protein FlhF